MARFRKRAAREEPSAAPREHQITIFERMGTLARSVEEADPTRPALGVFWTVLALMSIGLLMQASHASTTLDSLQFGGALREQILFRCGAIGVMIAAYRIGPQGLRRFIPALCLLSALALVLVFVPGFAAAKNGAHRWLALPGLSFQPSELARVVMILWIADRCMRLGARVRDVRAGMLPMLCSGLSVCLLILVEPDLGGAMLFLICFVATMWVGGARPVHVAGSLVGFGGTALLIAFSFLSYVRHRIEMWLGEVSNHQVDRTAAAIASGDWWGVGLGQGLYRNARVPYLESDYVFALIGEELGLAGLVIVLGLFAAFAWYSLKLVLSIRDRYQALCAFGLLLSVGLQAMLHVQVVTRLAPPKGMTLPFVSHGGTALIVSSLAVGLALGAARGPVLRPSLAKAPVRGRNRSLELQPCKGSNATA